MSYIQYAKDVIHQYKNLDIYNLWREHADVRDNIDKAIREEYVNDLKELQIESKVLYKLIKRKSIDEKIWLLNRLRDAKKIYEERGNKEVAEFLEEQVNFFENNYF